PRSATPPRRPPCTWAPRTAARNGNSRCATTASASSRSTSSASSWCSSACTTRASTRERGSAWRSSRRWSSATAAASGCNPSSAPAPRFISPCQKRGKPRMDDATKGSRPVEILLVEDNPGDERLTRDVLKTYGLHANCYVTKPVDLDKFIHVVKSIDAFWLSVVTLPSGQR